MLVQRYSCSCSEWQLNLRLVTALVGEQTHNLLSLSRLLAQLSLHPICSVCVACCAAACCRLVSVFPQVRSLSFNFKDPSNPDLRARVLQGQIDPQVHRLYYCICVVL